MKLGFLWIQYNDASLNLLCCLPHVGDKVSFYDVQEIIKNFDASFHCKEKNTNCNEENKENKSFITNRYQGATDQQ